MSPAAVTATPPSNGTGANPHDGNDDIRHSIAALRSVLMLDTPARNILGQRIPSPASHLPPQIQQQQGRSSSSTAERGLSGTTLQERLDDEITRRKELELAHESLSKLQKQQSSQLGVVTKSRQNLEDQLVKKRMELRAEEEARSQERLRWKQEMEVLRRDYEQLQRLLRDKTHQIQHLNQSLGVVNTQQLEALQSQLQPKQAENDQLSKGGEGRLAELRQDTEAARSRAETAEKALAIVQEELTGTKRDLAVALEKLSMATQTLMEKAQLEKRVQEISALKDEADQKLEDMSQQLEDMTEKMKVAQTAKAESEARLHDVVGELSVVKQQLQEGDRLRQEKCKLEEQLNCSEESKNEMGEKLRRAEAEMRTLSLAVQEKEQLNTENKSLLQRLREAMEKIADMDGLKAKLEANQSIVMNNDEMIRNIELELEESRTELYKSAERETSLTQQLREEENACAELRSEFQRLEKDMKSKEQITMEKDKEIAQLRETLAEFEQQKEIAVASADAASDLTVKNLQLDIKRLQQEKITLSRQLQTVKKTHENHLIEVATNREKVREVEGLLEDSRNRVAELESILDEKSTVEGTPSLRLSKRSRKGNNSK